MYRSIRLRELATNAGLDDETVNWLSREDIEVVVRTPAEQMEFEAMIEAANQPVHFEENRRAAAAAEFRRSRRKDHSLALAADEYARLAEGVLDALRPMLDTRADALVLASLDTISRFSYVIAVKTRRAVGALVADDEDNDLDNVDDDDFKSSDGNGCAKLVRLIVSESRDAWSVLTQIGSAVADGVPAAMMARLDSLDAALAEAFPRAMEFVRAGFDEES